MPERASTSPKAATASTKAAVPSLNVRKQQMVRDAIWDAAIDLIAEKGFDETTVEDIARAAGTSRRSFFRYFASKNDLMAQPIVSYGNVLTESILHCPAGLPLPEVVRHVVREVTQLSVTFPRARKVMAIAEKYPAAREAQMARVAGLQEAVEAAFVERGRRSGSDELTVHVAAGLTLLVLNATFRAWFEHPRGGIAAAAEQVFAVLGQLVGDASSQSRKGRPRSSPASPARKRS
jgi:AcrR family transcriptional regulator